MKQLLFAAIAVGFLAQEANAGTLLNDLAASENTTSPYATGGDVILKLGDYEYVHIFTNAAPAESASYAFVAQRPMTVRILAVGGGGAGGAGWCGLGGGGAGGMIDTNGVAIADGTYLVTVGSGGASVSTASTTSVMGGNGGDSAFGDVVVAKGGGGGNGGTGGSGGGAAKGGIAGSGVDGQGYGGGSVSEATANTGSGGGGAGGLGGDASGGTGGNGGRGLMSDILGKAFYFAGGGAGCSSNSTLPQGGIGGGGSGGNGNGRGVVPISGEDGLGAGGGGAGDTSSGTGATMVSGMGGTGIVAVRYFCYDGAEPFVESAAVEPEGSTFLTVRGRLTSLGAGASSVSITFDAVPRTDGEPKHVVIAGAVEDLPVTGFEFSKMVFGFTAQVAYDWTLTFENNLGEKATESGSFTLTGFTPVVEGTYVVSNFTDDASIRIWEFTDTTEAVRFTPNQNVTLRGLVVGGGGAGGCGWGAGTGGGGAGGMIDSPSVVLKAGITYYLAVGKGGAPVLSHSTGNGTCGGNGGDSAIYWLTDSGLTTNYVVRAFGGGGGGGNGLAGSAGGSGGGGGTGNSGGNGVDGQGNVGGSAIGGGGGASKAGSDGSGSMGGKGGDGKVSDILGYDKVFAGGGGGGYQWGSTVGGAGGEGGGGEGGNRTYAAGNGVDGLGGGGGGGPDDNVATYPHPGRGGSGIIVLRYKEVVPTIEPSLTLGVSDIGYESATLNVNVLNAGLGENVSLTMYYGREETAEDLGSVPLATGVMGVQTFPLTGLTGCSTYYVKIKADNGLDDGIGYSETVRVDTTRTWDGAFKLSGLTDTPKFEVTLKACPEGSTGVLQVWIGDNAESLELLAEREVSAVSGVTSITDIAIPRTDYTIAKTIALKYVYTPAEGSPIVIDSADTKTYYTVPKNTKLAIPNGCVVVGGAGGMLDGKVAENNMNGESGRDVKLDFVSIGGSRHLTGGRFVSRWWGMDWRTRMAGVTIQYSEDGVAWTDLYTVPVLGDMNPEVSDVANPVWQPIVFPEGGVDARFIRWNAEAGGNVVELELYTDELRIAKFEPAFTACDIYNSDVARVRSANTTLKTASDLDGGGMKFTGTLTGFESVPDVYVVASTVNFGAAPTDFADWQTKGVVRKAEDVTTTAWSYDFNDLPNGKIYFYTAYVVAKEDGKVFWQRSIYSAIAGEGRWTGNPVPTVLYNGALVNNGGKFCDGNFSTVDWNRNGKAETYITYDLGANFVKKHRLSRVRLFYRGSVAERLYGGIIQVSNDGVTWTDKLTLDSTNVYKDGDGTINSITEVLFKNADAWRYVRLNATGCTAHNYLELNEFEVLVQERIAGLLLIVK